MRHPSIVIGFPSFRSAKKSTGAAQFNVYGAVYAARGYHDTAEMLQKFEGTDLEGRHLSVSMRDSGISWIAQGGPEIEVIPRQQPHRPAFVYLGRAISAVVLEALAIELVLKVKLHQAGKRLPKTHDHAALFARLPATERHQVGQRFHAGRQPNMLTLEEVLAYSAPAFEHWRYLHEHSNVEASLSDMREAFEALAHGVFEAIVPPTRG